MPDGWAWCRITAVSSEIFAGGDKPDIFSKDKTSICCVPIYSNGIENYGLYGYTNKARVTSPSLTISARGTIGFCCIREEPFVPIIRLITIVPSKINLLYLKFVFEDLIETGEGSSIPQLTVPGIKPKLIPVPPLKEQMRIASKTNSLFNVLAEIESNVESVNVLIAITKSKILDLAIQGKLVPQDPNDEPASVLIERIRAEKEELIKQGKIKRDKKESVIFKGDDNSYYLNKDGQSVDIGDDIPFDIPNSWEWTLLGNIVQLNPRNKISDDMEVSFVPMPLIDDGFSGNHVSEIRKWNDVKTGFTHFAEGDIGVAKITPCFENRKSTVFNNLCNGYGAGTTELHILRTYADTISHKFLLFFVKTDFFIQAGKQTFSGAVGQQRIGKEYISNSLFPLPPLAEQKRIVNTIEALFAQIDKIAEQIS